MNGMQLYQGVVEDRMDPLRLGRCKIRVYGVHTNDPVILPTYDLPWAYPIMPVSSASISGVGTAPVGPVEGTVCIIYFADSEQQVPMMIGTVGGIPQAPGMDQPIPTFYQDESIPLDPPGLLDPGAGANAPTADVPVGATWDADDVARVEELRAFNEELDGEGFTATLTPEELEYARWKGYVSVPEGQEEYYANLADPRNQNRGVSGTVSQDGVNQTADGTSSPANPEDSQEGDPFITEGAATPPPDVDDPSIFDPDRNNDADAQRFNLTDARPASSFDISQRGLAFLTQYEGFSATAYHDVRQYSIGFGSGKWFGRTVTRSFPGTVTRAQAYEAKRYHLDTEFIPAVKNNVNVLITQDMFDAMVSLCYNIGPGQRGFAGSSVVRFINQGDYEAAASAFLLWNKAGGVENAGLARRRAAEARMFLGQGVPDGTGELRPANDLPPVGSTSGGTTSGGQADTLVYPRYTNEPDSNRLARGQGIERSQQYAREAAIRREIPMPRVGAQEMVTETIDTPAGPQEVEREADPQTWDQSESGYNAQYPFNHVQQSQTGHTFEMDDSPDSERLALFHRKGTGTEIDHNGTRTDTTVGDNYEMNGRHSFVYVGGNNTLYIGGAWNVRVDNGSNIHIVGDTNITVDNDVNLYVAGDVNGNVKGDMAVNVDGNTNLYSKGNLFATAELSADIYSKGNTVLTSESDTIVKTQGNLTATARGNAEVNVNGDATATVGGQMTQSVNGTLAIKAEKILMESRSSIDILGSDIVKVHSSGASTQIQQGAAATGVERHEAISDLEAVPEREDNPHESVETSPPDIPELTVNGRRSQYEEQFEGESPNENGQAFRDAMVANGIYQQEDLDRPPVVVDTQSPAVNPELLTPVENCDVIRAMANNSWSRNLSLSPRYTLGIMTKNMSRPPTAQFGLSQQDIVCNLRNVCVHVAEIVRDKHPNVTINSAFRRPGDVRASSRTSQHYLGQALDFGFPGYSRRQGFEAAIDLVKTLPYGFDQLILEYGNSFWIHISFKVQGNRNTYFTMKNHSRIGEYGQFTLLDNNGRPVTTEGNIQREARLPPNDPDSSSESPVDEIRRTGATSTAVQEGATEQLIDGVGLGISEAEYDNLSRRDQATLRRETEGTRSYERAQERATRNAERNSNERPQGAPARQQVEGMNPEWSSQAQVVARDYQRLYGDNWRDTLYQEGSLNDDNIEQYLEDRYRSN